MPEPFAETPSQEIEYKKSLKEKTVDLTVENIRVFVGWVRRHKIKAVLVLAFIAWNLSLIAANLDGLGTFFGKVGAIIGNIIGIGGN